MANVISADSDADKHYRHEGFSSTVIDSYSSPGTYPTGISWDGINVLDVDESAGMHYKHEGFSSTITSSYYTSYGGAIGIGWDGTNVLGASETDDKHYKHSGFSNTLTSSYTSPGTYPWGIAWDGTNVISVDDDAIKHYKHSGFSSTITDSYTAPGEEPHPKGIGWDGTNVISAGSEIYKTHQHYKHSGFSSTITDQYYSPSTYPTGIAWDTSTGTGYNVAISISQVLAFSPNEFQLNTTYTTVPIVRKRLRYIDTDLTDDDIEQYIIEAEGIIDAIMTGTMKDIFDASKHDTIRAAASDLAALQCIAYDPSAYPTIEAADMAADLLNSSLESSLKQIANPRNVKYWRSL